MVLSRIHLLSSRWCSHAYTCSRSRLCPHSRSLFVFLSAHNDTHIHAHMVDRRQRRSSKPGEEGQEWATRRLLVWTATISSALIRPSGALSSFYYLIPQHPHTPIPSLGALIQHAHRPRPSQSNTRINYLHTPSIPFVVRESLSDMGGSMASRNRLLQILRLYMFVYKYLYVFVCTHIYIYIYVQI